MDKMQEKIAIELSKQETSISNLLHPAQFLKETSQLHKLPLAGDQFSEDKFDFEWPTQEIWDEMENQE